MTREAQLLALGWFVGPAADILPAPSVVPPADRCPHCEGSGCNRCGGWGKRTEYLPTDDNPMVAESAGGGTGERTNGDIHTLDVTDDPPKGTIAPVDEYPPFCDPPGGES